MGLNKIFKSAVKTIFKTFSDFIINDVVLIYPDPDYNPVSGEVGGTPTTLVIDEIIFVDYEKKEIDGDIIRSLDKKALIQAVSITIGTIDTDMKLEIDGDTWDIVDVTLDPSKSLYETQSRRP